MQETMIAKAKEMLQSGKVSRVVGWRRGEFDYDVTPSSFEDVKDLERSFVYDDFCGPNLSKYLVRLSHADGKTLVFLKPCDTYSFNQLLKEHRIDREKVYIVAVPCEGKVDNGKAFVKAGEGIIGMESDGKAIKAQTLYGEVTFQKKDVLAERCVFCKSKKHVVYDELLGEEGDILDSYRFDMVSRLERMTGEQRFAFWRNELSRCIRCNACRDVCPACTCEKCVFDNDNSGAYNKAPANPFEENMYHIIRAFHVAGRCTDCGECSRVCPEHIPLHLLNRKFIKDIDGLYGEYQAGGDMESVPPLTLYTKGDPDPSVVMAKGGEDHA